MNESNQPPSHHEARNRPFSGMRVEPAELCVDVTSWNDFVDGVPDDIPGWIFRGQPDYNYPVTSKLQRAFEDKNVPRPQWGEIETGIVERFQKHAKSILPSMPTDDNLLGWLAIMQHYGVETRLIDFSDSPLIAAYFAYCNSQPGADVAVWALNANYCRQAYGLPEITIDSGAPDFPSSGDTSVFAFDADYAILTNEIFLNINDNEIWPFPIRPTYFDERMKTQKAAFVCDPSMLKSVDHLMEQDEWKYPKGAIRHLDPSGARAVWIRRVRSSCSDTEVTPIRQMEN